MIYAYTYKTLVERWEGEKNDIVHSNYINLLHRPYYTNIQLLILVLLLWIMFNVYPIIYKHILIRNYSDTS